MPRWIAALLLLATLQPTLPAAASALGEVEIYDRTSGRILPQYRRDGRLYVAGEPGHEYEIRVSNASDRRVLAVTSVDGVNVVTGQTASTAQSGYVLDPYGNVDIAGWRKSLDRVATFYFTSLPDSYAARTGRPDDVGVIGVALFREKQPWRWPWDEPDYRKRSGDGFGSRERAESPASAPPSVGQESDAQGHGRASPKLGTGHGRSEESWSQHTAFERASERPDEVITIWYDSRRNLVAQGVIREPRRYAGRRARPFPDGFVPDP